MSDIYSFSSEATLLVESVGLYAMRYLSLCLLLSFYFNIWAYNYINYITISVTLEVRGVKDYWKYW